MARLLRVQFAGAIYHVSVRGNERRRIFKDDKDRQRFLEQLAEAQELHRVRRYLVCLMPNHFQRGAAVWALVRHAGLTERAAGEILGMGTGSAVSQQLAKWRRNVSADVRYQTIDTELERKLATVNF